MDGSSVKIGDVERAYREFRPTLLRALATLARRGFGIGVSDGLDFIHDFFLEQWSSVCINFNPAKGRFEPYLYGAFVHFARPRIVRLRRLQESLVDPQSLDVVEDNAMSVEERVVTEIDCTSLLMGFERLPVLERKALIAYVYSNDRSERALARRFSVSRYRIRESLVGALGRIITAFPKRPEIGDKDWSVAVSIWSQNRTPQEVADSSGVTLKEVKESLARTTSILTEALKQMHLHEGPRTTTMQKPAISAVDLLNKTLNSPGNEELLDRLKIRAAEILSVVDSQDVELSAHFGDEKVIWIARVYEALSGQERTDLAFEEAALERALFETSRQDLQTIGRAFVEALLPDLPSELRDFRGFFAALPSISTVEWNDLSKELDVIVAFPDSAVLGILGIRPVTVFYAAEAISALVDRLLRREVLTGQNVIIARTVDGGYEFPSQDPELPVCLPREIELMCECTPEAAVLLLEWLVRVAEYKPHIFAGFEARLTNKGLSLERNPHEFGSLFEQWGPLTMPSVSMAGHAATIPGAACV